MDEKTVEIKVRINGADHEVRVPTTMTLLELIRDELGLTARKEDATTASADPAPS